MRLCDSKLGLNTKVKKALLFIEFKRSDKHGPIYFHMSFGIKVKEISERVYLLHCVIYRWTFRALNCSSAFSTYAEAIHNLFWTFLTSNTKNRCISPESFNCDMKSNLNSFSWWKSGEKIKQYFLSSLAAEMQLISSQTSLGPWKSIK